jgi:cytidyltransferase-like protein
MSDSKICTLEELADRCRRLRADGKTIVHCHGAFDLLHPGHIRHLASASRLGDVLVVTITEDRFIRKGPGRPVFNERLRAESVAAMQTVSFVATSPFPTAVETIRLIQPQLYVKGQDYRDASADATGAIAEEEREVVRGGGRLVFTDDIQFSSSHLLNRFLGVFTDEQRAYLSQVRERFSADDVMASLDSLKGSRVVVIGEAILDEYHYCSPDAMSNKTPTLSARFESAEVFAGGVIAVANHLAGLCGEVTVLAGTGGQDDGDAAIRAHLSPGVRFVPVPRDDAPTIRKRRYISRFQNQKLFEITFLNDHPLPEEAEARLMAAVDAHAPDADVVIVVDFGHGFFTPRSVHRIREKSRFMAVNAQINSSNRGFNSIRKYKGADYFSIDEYEIRLPFGDRYGELRGLMRRLSEDSGCHRINVTLGHRGSMYYDGERYHAAPVLTNTTVDAVGAGDALLAITAPLVHRSVPAELIPLIGNAMGGLMAQIVGHRTPVDAVLLRKFLTTLLK